MHWYCWPKLYVNCRRKSKYVTYSYIYYLKKLHSSHLPSLFVTGAAGRFATKMKNFPFNPFFSPETSQSEEDISPESFVEFLTEFFQHQRDRSDAGLDQGSFFDPPRWAAPLREPECASCHSKTENLKRCSGCKRVFYCSKTCQKNHWKEHKPDCQSSWNQKLVLDLTWTLFTWG